MMADTDPDRGDFVGSYHAPKAAAKTESAELATLREECAGWRVEVETLQAITPMSVAVLLALAEILQLTDLQAELTPQRYVKAASDLHARATAAEAKVIELEAWKNAVIDELILSETLRAEHETDPKRAVHDAICWNVAVALDPAVSEDARKLIAAAESRVAELEAEVACLTAQLENHTAYTITHRGALRYCNATMRDAYSDETVRADVAESRADMLAEELAEHERQQDDRNFDRRTS